MYHTHTNHTCTAGARDLKAMGGLRKVANNLGERLVNSTTSQDIMQLQLAIAQVFIPVGVMLTNK